jgi:Phage tail lysozyme
VAAATTLSCNLSYSMLPANVTAIVSFLVTHGYSHNAAAGIAGNIYQESKGDPESVGMGGGGLIGFTPLPAGYVTGNPAADLQTQLSAVLTYNQGWSQFLPALNSAASPSAAASIYVTDFERAGIPAASTRESSAENVANACGL